MNQTRNLLVPPTDLLTRNPARWFRFFGPGAIIASVTIGSGELVFPSRGGAMFGYNLLWIFLWVGALKWVLAYCSMRHMVLSGAHPLERWSHILGPRGWLPLFIMIIIVSCSPMWFAFLSGLLGEACAWISGWSNKYVWAIIGSVAGILMLATGGYKFMEKAQLLFLGIMVFSAFIAVIYVGPEWLKAIKYALIPQKLAYPDWAFNIIPDLTSRSEWVEILVYVSAIGGQSTDYLAYTSLLREKKWGHSDNGVLNRQELEEISKKTDHPARLWVRAALVDTLLSFIMVILVASCFSVLGTELLQPKNEIPNGMDLLTKQAEFLTVLSKLLLPLYMLAVFLAFFGILYSGPELAYRIFCEYINTVPWLRKHVSLPTLRWCTIFWCLGFGLILLWITKTYPEIGELTFVSFAAIIMGVLLCGFYCIANPWVDWRFLPTELRMSSWLFVSNIIAGLIFLFAGLKGLWDFEGWKWLSYAILFAAVVLSMGLSLLFRFMYDEPK